MILQDIKTGIKITISRNVWLKDIFYRDTTVWKDVTPPRTRKQVEQSHLFIERGKIERARSCLMMVPLALLTKEEANCMSNMLKILGVLIKSNQEEMSEIKNIN